MRILIVENSAIIAMHLASLVADLGHEVCATSASASDAIARAAALKPDVVIMDTRSAVVRMLNVCSIETSLVTGARWLRRRDLGPQDVSEARFARIMSLARDGHQRQPGSVVGARDKRSYGSTCETAKRFASFR
jgi:DNA-binding NarL/FixJ family response regulator